MAPDDRVDSSGSARLDPHAASGPDRGQEDEWNALWKLYGRGFWRGFFWTVAGLVAPKWVIRKALEGE